MTTIQDASAKGPRPYVRPFVEYLYDIRYLLALAACLTALLFVFAYAITPAHAEYGDHSSTPGIGSPKQFGDRDIRSGRYTGNPPRFSPYQRSITSSNTLGQIAANIRNTISNWATKIGDFIENNFRYHYEATPDQMGILAAPG